MILFKLFQVVIHNIRLPKQSTVGDVINVLKTKVSLSISVELMLFAPYFNGSFLKIERRITLSGGNYYCKEFRLVPLSRSFMGSK